MGLGFCSRPATSAASAASSSPRRSARPPTAAWPTGSRSSTSLAPTAWWPCASKGTASASPGRPGPPRAHRSSRAAPSGRSTRAGCFTRTRPTAAASWPASRSGRSRTSRPLAPAAGACSRQRRTRSLPSPACSRLPPNLLAARDQPIDGAQARLALVSWPALGHQIDAPGVVLADRDQIAGSEPEAPLLPDAPVGARAEAIDPARAVVAEDVVAVDLPPPDSGQVPVSDGEPSGHCAARSLSVGDRGEHRVLSGDPAVERRERLKGGPAEIRTARLRERQEVDLLEAILARIGDGDVAGDAVERDPSRVPQPIRPDLVAPRPADEGVAGRDRVAARRWVDPQDLAEQLAPVLCDAGRIARRATVTGPHVQVPVGTEGDQAAVVGGRRLGDAEDRPTRPRVGDA